MAASGAKNVGSYGQIRVLVDLVSQDTGANTSRVRVRGQMALRQGSNANNQNGVHMKTTASPGGSTTESNPFSVGTSWVTVIDNTYTVSHAADGNRTVTGTFELGATGTTSFGSGGSVSLALKLPRIPQVPSKPGTPTVSNITSNSARINWSHPNNNGAILEEYQVQRATNSGFTAGVVTASGVTGTSYTRTGLAANTTYWVRIRVRNAAGWSAWSGGRSFTTKVNSPAAPTNVSATRVNDERHNIGWTRHATSDAPYTSQRVLRRAFTAAGWGDWISVANLSGTATSFTDTSTVGNAAYEWTVQAVNGSGEATAARTDTLRTSPAAPTSVAARRRGDAIDITFVNSYPGSVGLLHEVQDNPGGTGWVTVGTTASDGTYSHQDPDPAQSHVYRVRTSVYGRGSSGARVTGAWSTSSNVVQLLAPPLAPSLVGPQGVADRDQPVRLEFEHNPVDTTDQTAGEVRWRPAGGSWTTVSTGTDPFYALPAPGTSGTFEWQARTRGEHASFGPWSPTWSFDAVSRPEVVIQSPQGTSDKSQAEVEWAYQNADSSGQSRWEAQLLDAEDNVLATGSGANTDTAHLFPTILEDNTTYTVRVRARAGSGLWSEWDTSTFVTDFPLPYPVEVLPEWDRETGSVAISFEIDDSDATELAPDSIDVQRDDGHGWITIATDLDPETSMVDYTPRLGEIRYRTISRTDLPTARTGPETVTEPPRGLWPVFLNGGPDLGDVLAIYDNTKLAFGRGRAKTRRIWAGRDWPTTKWGQARSKTVALTATISPESPGATVADVEALEDMPSVVCVRDILGHKIFVTIDDVDSDVERDGRWNISIPMTREHYIEGVR